MFHCSICRCNRPDEGPTCGYCGSHRDTCETAEPPKQPLRCMKCGGSSFRVDLQRRAECRACGFATACLGGAVIKEPPQVVLPASSVTPWVKGRRVRPTSGRCDGRGKRVS